MFAELHSAVKAPVTWGAAGLMLVAVNGCGVDPMKKVHVHGTVTFDGQACPGPGRITFSPLEVAPGVPKRPASGAFSEDGAYEATSFRPGDGLFPGRYQVGIACFDPSRLSGAPSDDEFRAASYVREDFEPPELVVEAGSRPITFNLDVPRR